MQRVSMRLVQGILAVATQLKLDVNTLLPRTGIAWQLLEHVDVYITYEQFFSLWQEIAHHSGQTDIGLQLAGCAYVGNFDFLGYVMASSANLQAAWMRLIHYAQVLHEGVVWSLEIKDQVAQLSCVLPCIHLPMPSALEQWIIANVVRGSRDFTGVDWTPLSIGFRHTPPQDLTTYQYLFRCPLNFNQPANYVQVAANLLQLPMLKADPALCSVLEHYADNLLKQFPPTSNFLDSVRRAMSEGLREGDTRAEIVAKRLGIVPRTLQRKLKELDTSYQALLDEMRRELSFSYLQNPNMAVSEVAFLLGFSDSSAFHHAFKRWTGSSPREFRRSAL